MTSTLTQQDTPAQQDRRQVEILGMIGTRDASESRPGSGPAIDPDYTRRFARAHEDAGFDRILIGYGSSWPEGTQVAAYVAAHTERLGLLVAHRPGFVAPTLAARAFATLDQFSGRPGRRAHHHRRHDAEQRRDGDYLDQDERYARTDEYLDHPRAARGPSTEPFDYEGRHYRFEDFAHRRAAVRRPHLPLYFGGSSEAAYRVGGKHADMFALWGEPLAETAEQIASVTGSRRGRRPRRRRGSACRSARSSRRPRSSPGSGRTGSSTGSRTAPAAVVPRGGQAQDRARPQNVGSQRLLARRREGRPARPRAVDPDRDGHRRRRQLDRARRHPGDGRGRRSSTTSTSASTPS